MTRLDGRILAPYARTFAELGVSDAAGPMLEELGWDGTDDPCRREAVDPAKRHERILGAAERHRAGIHYTPMPIARGLAREAIAAVGADADVGDPACGAGVFLLAAAEELRSRGVPVTEILTERLWGADTDASAIGIAHLELAVWSSVHAGQVCRVPESHLLVADGLGVPGGTAWVDRVGERDVVVGNPPFGSQLKGDTVRTRSERRHLADHLGIGSLGYADTAALFLVRATMLTRDDGFVSMILPASVAAAAGSARARAAIGLRSRPVGVWIGGDDVGFDAAVRVWAPMFRVEHDRTGRAPRIVRITRFADRALRPAGEAVVMSDSDNWSAMLVDHSVGVDSVDADRSDGVTTGPSRHTMGSVAEVTAGFRQHFYGLVAHVVDDVDDSAHGPVLVTTGAVDPLHHRVDAPVRFAGRLWRRPVVDVEAIARCDPSLHRWVRGLMVPKVIVASQGRVLEAVADPEGDMIPSTPAIALIPRPGVDVSVWHLAAALCSPSASMRLHRQAAGTGLGAGTCRVTARFVSSLPAPCDREAWDLAADAARRATTAAAAFDAARWERALDDVAAAMLCADGPGDAWPGRNGDALFEWWREQRPRWRGVRSLTV